VALIWKFEIFSRVQPMFTTNAFLTLLIDLNSPSIKTYKPGYMKVERRVKNPESLCSGATKIYSLGSSSTTFFDLGK
jgi:hypothetical protein